MIAHDSYLAGVDADADAVVGAPRREVEDSLSAGYRSSRISGEMGWALRVIGTVDHRNADALAEALGTAGRTWRGDVVVDMGESGFLDLGGIRALVQAARELRGGRRVRVVEVPPLLCRVIALAGFDQEPALVVSARGVVA